MVRVLLSSMALVALAACQPAVPDSGAGVGFDRVDRDRAARANRDAQLAGQPPQRQTIAPPSAVQQRPLDAANGTPQTTLDQRADAAARARNSGEAPVDASPSNPPPRAVTNSVGISREQDFDAVSGRRTIQSDAERLAAARAQYRLIEPGALPTRPGTNVPNIVQFAIQTNNPVGAGIYRRSRFNAQAKFQRNCAAYASADLAQEDFLTRGGPQKDRLGLDPDGDGFACGWDPTPFRRAVRANPSNGG